jgi:phenylacetate 2-hydroxylase
MSFLTTSTAVIAVVFFLIRYLNRTDTPKIKNLPEIPGIPLFGNLLQFGSSHAKVAGELAKKYGPVFQVRLGNRVFLSQKTCPGQQLMENSESSLPTPSTPFVIFGSRISQH